MDTCSLENGGHQNGPYNQHPATPNPVSARREIKRDHRIADERQREKSPV
jgi:hypothetical protein